MKSFFSSKITKSIVVAAAVCVVSISCYAGVKYMAASYTSHSYTAFDKAPSASELEEAAGFLPKYTEQFENGYVLTKVSIGETSANDEEGNILKKFPEVNITYEKDGASCMIGASEANEYNETAEGTEVTLGDITGRYSVDNYKFVGSEEDVTEEDRELEKQGKLYISYGGDTIKEPELQTFQYLSWTDEGIRYSASCFDTKVTKEDLVQMAKELINQ